MIYPQLNLADAKPSAETKRRIAPAFGSHFVDERGDQAYTRCITMWLAIVPTVDVSVMTTSY